MNDALSAVGLYVALSTIIALAFAERAGRLRRANQILNGDGGNKHLAKVIRGHANAIENMPLFLLGLLAAALMGMPVLGVHVLGLVFVVGRALHSVYFIAEKGDVRYRFYGFGIALIAQMALVLGLLAHGVWQVLS